MKYSLLILYFHWLLHTVVSEKPPTSTSDSYEQSLGNFDQSVGWNMVPAADNTFPASNHAPPFKKFSKKVEIVNGIESDPDLRKGSKKEDTSVFFQRHPEQCLTLSNFSDPNFVCLQNPNKCDLSWPAGDLSGNSLPVRGLSFSLWVNIPNSFHMEEEYILDTGGRVDGTPGISIMHTPSIDAKRYSQFVTVVVSTGQKVWTGVINGMLSSHFWNNIGIRWSEDSDTVDGAPLGLQIFVNKTRVFWRRSAVDSPGLQFQQPDSIQMTLGCKLDGSMPMRGRIDQPSFWMWWLKDNQIEYFDGSLAFKTPVVQRNFARDEIKFIPWLYEVEVLNATLHDGSEQWLDDTTSAKGVVCDPTMVSESWGESPFYKRQKEPHPIDCAVTVKQLTDAMSYQSPYTGEALTRAIVRIANKAGPTGLRPTDLRFLITTAYTTLVDKLMQETNVDELLEGKFYGNLVFLLSKLQERDIYKHENYWIRDLLVNQQQQENNKLTNVTSATVTVNGTESNNLDLTAIVRLMDAYLIQLGHKLKRKYNILIESNNTVTSISKLWKADATSGVLFPDYTLTVQTEDSFSKEEPFYTFPTQRSESWGHGVNDYLSLTVPFFQAYDIRSTELIIVTQLNNQLGLAMPANIDERVTGLGNAKLYPNSKVISVEVVPENENTSEYIQLYPLEIMLTHKQIQPEQPYKKGAMVCAHWNFNHDDTKLGAWDTGYCNVTFTNDTHTICLCAKLGYFTVLAEDYTPGGLGDAGYYICAGLYYISLLLMIIGMFLIIAKKRLHNEMHVMIMNQYFCLICAIISYGMTQIPNVSRLQCLSLSAGMMYFYTAYAIWTLYHCDKVRKTLKKHYMNGNMGSACLMAYGVPAISVSICAFIIPESFGVGFRCFAYRNDFIIWLWLGGIFAISALSVIQLVCCAMLRKDGSQYLDPEDSKDIFYSMLGCTVMTVLHTIDWLLVMLVHVFVSSSPIMDFNFEFVNSLLGLMSFIFLTVLIPSSRDSLLCRPEKVDEFGLSWAARRKKTTRVFYEEMVRTQRIKDLQDLDDDDY